MRTATGRAMTTKNDDEIEKPLDPATEKVRRKMVRLLAVSIGVMMIGLMAVLAAVVYKSVGSGGSGPVAGSLLTIALPAGAEVLDTTLDGDRALLRADTPDGMRLFLISLANGAVIASYRIEPGAAALPE